MYIPKTEKKICCPLEWGLDVFGGKWKSHILCVLHNNGKLRFGDLKKILPDITDPVLSSMLKELTKSGLIERFQYNEIPPRVEYSLTEQGNSVIDVLQYICKWSSEHSDYSEEKVFSYCKNCTIVK